MRTTLQRFQRQETFILLLLVAILAMSLPAWSFRTTATGTTVSATPSRTRTISTVPTATRTSTTGPGPEIGATTQGANTTGISIIPLYS